MEQIVLNNKLKMRLNRYVDILNIEAVNGELLTYTSWREHVGIQNNKFGIMYHLTTANWVYMASIKTALLVDTPQYEMYTGISGKFARKEVRLLSALDETLSLYEHNYPMTDDTTDTNNFWSATYRQAKNAPLKHEDNVMEIDPTDGNLWFTLVPPVILPLTENSVGKEITKFEVKVFDTNNKLTLEVKGTVSDLNGTGDVKLNNTILTEDSSIKIVGLHKFKMKLPNVIPVEVVEEPAPEGV